jgi:putative flippase GtrA
LSIARLSFEWLERLWGLQFFRFAVVGTTAFVVDTAVLYAAIWAGLGLYAGRAVSYLVAATFTWYGNRRLTFSTHAHGAPAIAAEWIRFLVANLAGGAVNYATYAAAIAWLPLVRAYPVLGVAAGSLAGLSVNFLASKFVVFRTAR